MDLAGSERLKQSKSTGGTMKETGSINRSLMALGKVITALSEAGTFPNLQAQLPPGGIQGWRACPHAQPGCPTRGAPPAEHRKAAPPTYLTFTVRSPCRQGGQRRGVRARALP